MGLKGWREHARTSDCGLHIYPRFSTDYLTCIELSRSFNLHLLRAPITAHSVVGRPLHLVRLRVQTRLCENIHGAVLSAAIPNPTHHLVFLPA